MERERVNLPPVYWKQSASLLSPEALTDKDGGDVGDEEALPLSSEVGTVVGVVESVAAGTGKRFLAPIDPFLKRTSWRGVDILVYSSVLVKRKEKK